MDNNNQIRLSGIIYESLTNGSGIRRVLFSQGCKHNCKGCFNPETHCFDGGELLDMDLIIKDIINNPMLDGVTFSGGEPLLQYDFLLETCKKLKENNIHIALDTSGVGNGDYLELLQTIDLVLLDIKHITKEGYIDITQTDNIDKFHKFVEQLNKTNVEVWIRQVIIPDVNDNEEYMTNLSNFIKTYIKNVKKIEFLPFHTMGKEKYKKLGIKNPYQDKQDMDKDKCNKLYEYFLNEYNK